MSDKTARLSKSAIPYLDAVWNVVTGCTPCSPACTNCYAERMTSRDLWGYDFTPRMQYDRLASPLRARDPRRIGVTFMGDLWHPDILDAWRDAVYAVMWLASRHTFVDLTKRSDGRLLYFHDPDTLGRIIEARHSIGRQIEATWSRAQLTTCYARSAEEWERLEDTWPLENVWQGATIWDQPSADDVVPVVLDTPAAVRFVSYEPALGPVDFTPWLSDCQYDGLNWVIAGPETGPGKRPFDPQWAVDVKAQCDAAGVAYFDKRDSHAEWRELPGVTS